MSDMLRDARSATTVVFDRLDALRAENARWRQALARIAGMPGAAVILMDDPQVARAVREAAEAEATFWAQAREARPATAQAAADLAARCQALSDEFNQPAPEGWA